MKPKKHIDIQKKINDLRRLQYNLQEISNLLDIPVSTVHYYMDKQEFKKYNAWTEDEINFLRLNYYKMSINDIALCLGRTYDQVVNKHFELRERKPEPIPDRRIVRPPTEYTNIPTPYGIATELHAGNRRYPKS